MRTNWEIHRRKQSRAPSTAKHKTGEEARRTLGKKEDKEHREEGGPRIVGKKGDEEQWGRIRVVFIHKHMTVANILKPAFLRVKLN